MRKKTQENVRILLLFLGIVTSFLLGLAGFVLIWETKNIWYSTLPIPMVLLMCHIIVCAIPVEGEYGE